MQAVSNHQSGSKRISPLLVAVAASVTIACLIGLSAYTGMLPGSRAPMRDEGPVLRSESKQPATCALCGTIESIKTVEVVDEAGGSPGAVAPSALDTQGGSVGTEAERNARRRLVFRVTLRMDDGSFRAISLSSPPAFSVGDKVRVVEGRLVRA
jgi:outer membrane lipoprotein SlyB